MEKGIFVTFEGGEGAGKSTLQRVIAERLIAKGFSVVKTREPGGSDLGVLVRSWLLDHNSISSRAELLLFLADRAQHVEQVILPALNEGKVVLCDRYSDSSIAYQGVARGLGEDLVEKMCAFATGNLAPDLTLLLDLPPEKGLFRAPGNDRMESEELEFHQKVREGFLSLAQKNQERYEIIDANQSVEKVLEQAWFLFKERFAVS